MMTSSPSYVLFARTLFTHNLPLATAYFWAERIGKDLSYRKVLLNATLNQGEAAYAILPCTEGYWWQIDPRKGKVATFEAAWAKMPRLLTHPDHLQDSTMVRVDTLLTPELEILWRALHRTRHPLSVQPQKGALSHATL